METIQGGSLTDAAATQLRNAILGGELQPGQPVRVRELQDRMGVSHIPIREAIRQLEAEGLIITSPAGRRSWPAWTSMTWRPSTSCAT